MVTVLSVLPSGCLSPGRDQIQLLHTCSPKYGTTEDNSDKGKSVDSIIFVNKAGERFVAEDERRDTICLAVLKQEDAL